MTQNTTWWDEHERILRSEKTPNRRLLYVFKECRQQHEKEVQEIAEQYHLKYMVKIEDVEKAIDKLTQGGINNDFEGMLYSDDLKKEIRKLNINNQKEVKKDES